MSVNCKIGKDVSYDEISMWRVGALKEFLRKRDLKVTGKKQELVARVFAATEQQIPISLQAAGREIKKKEEQSRLLETEQGILPDPSTLKDNWIGEVKGMSEWPPLFLSDITMYIMRDHPGNDISLQTRLLNEYKEGKAYRLYDGGWLKEISFHRIKDGSKYCFMKAQCTPSMKINDTAHNVWICVSKVTGNIHSAYCSCTAGLGGSCAHITAMLFRIEAAVRAGFNKPACTSKLCEWNIPSKKTKIEPLPVKDMNFRAVKFNKVPSRPTTSAGRKLFHPTESHKETQDANCRLIFDNLKEIIPNGCFTSLFKRESEGTNSTMDEVATTNMNSSSKNSNLIIQLANKSKTVEEFLGQLPILTESAVENIEHETVGQSNNDMWILQRKGRITASNFYFVFTKVNSIKQDSEKDCPVEPLIKKLMGYEAHKQDIPSLNYGHKFEPIAREKYLSITRNAHSGFKFRECGLFIDLQNIYLGASPDPCINCDCCGSGIVEFKCPSSIPDKSPSIENLNYLVSNGSATTLKRKHSYFAQIQGQMGVTKKKYCDFFVYTQVGYFTERIYYDHNYWCNLLINLEYFFHNFLTEELVFERIKKKLESSKKTQN